MNTLEEQWMLNDLQRLETRVKNLELQVVKLEAYIQAKRAQEAEENIRDTDDDAYDPRESFELW